MLKLIFSKTILDFDATWANFWIMFTADTLFLELTNKNTLIYIIGFDIVSYILSLMIIYRSFNPKHWVSTDEQNLIECVFKVMPEYQYPPTYSALEAWRNRKQTIINKNINELKAWCQKNCKGRWKIRKVVPGYDNKCNIIVAFAAKEDAALCIIFHETERL
jgi:hypothetical protein